MMIITKIMKMIVMMVMMIIMMMMKMTMRVVEAKLADGCVIIQSPYCNAPVVTHVIVIKNFVIIFMITTIIMITNTIMIRMMITITSFERISILKLSTYQTVEQIARQPRSLINAAAADLKNLKADQLLPL